MKKSLLLTLPLGLTLLAPQASADRLFHHPGSVCRPATPTDASCLRYDQYGVRNDCSSPRTVECPLRMDYHSTDPTVQWVALSAYDRSTVSNVSCLLHKTNGDGSTVVVLGSWNISTSSSGSSAMQPVAYPNVGQGGWWRLRCAIPAVQGGQFSHLTSVLVHTDE